MSVKVFYASNHGVAERVDPLYGRSFRWDIPLLDGYEHEFLRSFAIPGLPGPTANRYPRELTRRLRHGRFDAVLLSGYMNASAWAGYAAAKRLGIPIILRGDSHLYQDRHLMALGLKSILLRAFLRGVSYCLAIGDWNHEYWRHYGVPEQKIRNTLFAVDNARFSAISTSSHGKVCELRSQWGVDRGDTVFTFAGNFQPHKGLDVLLEAFKRLRARRDDVHLVLIGEGPLGEGLKAKAAGIGGIHWPGFVNQSELPVYLAASDMFVLPSRKEPWGLVVNEAMASGVPCIVSSAVGAGPDLISRPDAGRVVPMDNISALEDAMNEACSPKLRAEWRTRLKAVLTRASYEDNVNVISDCMTEICGGDESGRDRCEY